MKSMLLNRALKDKRPQNNKGYKKMILEHDNARSHVGKTFGILKLDVVFHRQNRSKKEDRRKYWPTNTNLNHNV